MIVEPSAGTGITETLLPFSGRFANDAQLLIQIHQENNVQLVHFTRLEYYCEDFVFRCIILNATWRQLITLYALFCFT